jgi:hypothetical protein
MMMQAAFVSTLDPQISIQTAIPVYGGGFSTSRFNSS